jgi:hypothetical protein
MGVAGRLPRKKNRRIGRPVGDEENLRVDYPSPSMHTDTRVVIFPRRLDQVTDAPALEGVQKRERWAAGSPKRAES